MLDICANGFEGYTPDSIAFKRSEFGAETVYSIEVDPSHSGCLHYRKKLGWGVWVGENERHVETIALHLYIIIVA
jgi:hypothetical protein